MEVYWVLVFSRSFGFCITHFKGALYRRLSRGDIDAPHNSSTPGLLPDRPPTPGGHPIAPPETPPPAAGAAGGAGHEWSRGGAAGEKLFLHFASARRGLTAGMGFRAIYVELIGEVWRGKKRTRAQAQYLSFIDNGSYTTLFGKRHARSRVTQDQRQSRSRGRVQQAHQKPLEKVQGTQGTTLYGKNYSFPLYRKFLSLSGLPEFSNISVKRRPSHPGRLILLFGFFAHAIPDRRQDIPL